MEGRKFTGDERELRKMKLVRKEMKEENNKEQRKESEGRNEESGTEKAKTGNNSEER